MLTSYMHISSRQWDGHACHHSLLRRTRLLALAADGTLLTVRSLLLTGLCGTAGPSAGGTSSLDGIFARMQSSDPHDSGRIDDDDDEDSGRTGLLSGPSSTKSWLQRGRR